MPTDRQNEPPNMPSVEPLYSGSCFCGAVKFKVSENPLYADISHSKDDMRLHGTDGRWTATFRMAHVRFEEESVQYLRWFNPATGTMCTEGAQRKLPCKLQCTRCGCWVADETADTCRLSPAQFEFPSGLPSEFAPSCHTHCGTRLFDLKDGLPRYLDDRQTPMSPEDFLLDIAPRLDGRSHKGQSGRVGVLGGSVDYTGAPYYAGMAALRIGAELLYVCTAAEAAGPIKSYSPELMVSGVYSWEKITSPDQTTCFEEQELLVERMEELLPKLHALVLGPGLGRDDRVFLAVARVIGTCRNRGMPLVVDADGLALVEKRPDLVRGYGHAVLTPNAAEFRRLTKAVLGDENATLEELGEALRGPVIVAKGRVDRIYKAGMSSVIECSEEGAPRRPGGLGDFLAGTIAVLVGWASAKNREPAAACQVATTLVRRACKAAYQKRRRSMVAPDVLEEAGAILEDMSPSDLPLSCK